MIMLHASFLEGGLAVWGETPLVALAVTGRRGRKPRASGSSTSPFDPGPAALKGALQAVVPALAAETLEIRPGALWLPTMEGRPVPSSPLVAEPPETNTLVELHAWTVTVAPLTWPATLDLLGALGKDAVLMPGVIAGSTLPVWAHAVRFAAYLAAHQQFLPDVTRHGATWRASWQPVLTATDRHRLGLLAQALPAAGRSLVATEAVPPQRSALNVLTEFVGAVLDYLTRQAATAMAPPVPARTGRRKAPHFDSLHDQWLHALRTDDGTLRGSATELADLAGQVQGWRAPLTLALASPFRLCFRLEEPPNAKDKNQEWTVRYLLQGRDDPSLLISAAAAWEPKGQTAAILRRGGFQSRGYLLAALGQAGRLCPPVEQSLVQADPDGFTADANGTQRFLTQQSLLLEQAGFGVLLPAWWTRKGTKQRLTVSAHVKSPPMQGGSGFSLEDIVQFEWRVALGDQPLTLKELEALARLKTSLVQVRGQWVQISAEEIQAALDFWKKRKTDQGSARELVLMALGAGPSAGGLEIAGVTATGWVGDLLARLEGQGGFEELPPPPGFHGTLRPYQTRGYSWLAFLRQWGLGACLADDMGLGKTIQTLALIQRDWENNGRMPVLLICPVSVVGNWKKEAERFTPDLPVLVHHGLKRTRGGSFAKEASKHALVLSSYSLVHRDQAQLEKVAWGGVILDEAQNIKNPNTKQARAARALTGGYRIALTGTPVENRVGDLWSIWEFLNAGFLGNQTEFRRRFFVPIQFQQDAEAAARLKRLTGPFLLRRLKTDKTIITDLPDKMEMKVYCNLTKEQASLYAAVVATLDKGLEGSEGIQRSGIILGALSTLKQVCNHPAHFLGDNSPLPGRSGKLARLTEMVDELLQTGDRALIFTQFTEMGELLRKHLQESFGREVLFLHGGQTRKQRDQMVARFQGADGPPLFLLSLKAGGTGLNLTAANHVFHFDRWWNPAVENQATDRAFRIGQTRNVQVHKFLCVGTLEEKIDEMLERKQVVAGHVVGSGEAWLTELSNSQLRDLFALREEAVED